MYIQLNDESCRSGLFQEVKYLERRSPTSEFKDLAWTTCADNFVRHGNHCIIVGTRSGGILLYNLSISVSLIRFIKYKVDVAFFLQVFSYICPNGEGRYSPSLRPLLYSVGLYS